ncbi:MAG: helix-turn-helix domain-containing protein [bacterium]|nr:helix-turn-helix domain-containing protein [bacterium]
MTMEAAKNKFSDKNALRTDDACEYLGGISRTTLCRWIKRGVIPPGIRMSSHCRLFLREDLDRALARMAVEG